MADLVLPDILVLGKALTGGYIGHAVTVANHKVFDAFYSDNDRHALMHGPTFMGNALACAVALKGLRFLNVKIIWEKSNALKKFHTVRWTALRIRGSKKCVLWAAVPVWKCTMERLEGFQQFAYERGVFCRPFLKYMYSMVPYIIEEEELVQIFDVMKAWFRRG